MSGISAEFLLFVIEMELASARIVVCRRCDIDCRESEKCERIVKLKYGTEVKFEDEWFDNEVMIGWMKTVVDDFKFHSLT